MSVSSRLVLSLASLFAVACFAARSASLAQAAPVVGPSQVAMCRAQDVSLTTDGEDGNFNGMSHAGTLLVLKNKSAAACRVPQRPAILFLKDGKPLPIKLEILGTRFMHPGPVLVPVTIAPGASAYSALRWVSGPVYEQNADYKPTAIAITLENGDVRAALRADIFGDKTKGVTFQATPFSTKKSD